MFWDIAFMHLRKSRNDEQTAHRSTARRRAIHRNHAAAALALDGIGDKALTVVDVPDVDLLVLGNIGGIQQIFIDRAGALVVQLTLRGLVPGESWISKACGTWISPVIYSAMARCSG